MHLPNVQCAHIHISIMITCMHAWLFHDYQLYLSVFNFDDHTSIYYYYEFNKVVGKWVHDAVWWQCAWLAGRWYWRAGRWRVGVVEVGVHGCCMAAGAAQRAWSTGWHCTEITAAWTGGFDWGHCSTNKHHIIHMVVRLASIWVCRRFPR